MRPINKYPTLTYVSGILLICAAPYIAALFTGKINAAEFLRLLYGGLFTLPLLLPSLIAGRRPAAVLTALALAPLGYLLLFYVGLYGANISGTTVFTLFETNIAEAREYASGYFKIDAPAAVFVILNLLGLAAALLAAKRAPWRGIMRVAGLGTLTAVLLLAIPTARGQVLKNNVIGIIGTESARYFANLRDYKQAVLLAAAPEPVKALRSGPEVHVLMLSESLSRARMGLYGYRRPTTPDLSEMAASLFAFDNVYSNHAHTIPVVMEMFSYKGADGKPVLWFNYIKKAGFKTYWLSNQQPRGLADNVVAVIGRGADYSTFRNTDPSDNTSDELLLQDLKEALAAPSDKKFIVLHLMGAHMTYKKRYPPNFEIFRGDCGKLTPEQCAVSNEYDNAVLYCDDFAGSVISLIKARNTKASVLYLSDHGEDVYDTGNFFGHAESLGTPFMHNVPFIVWLSDGYKKQNPALTNTLTKNLREPYRTDKLIFSVFDLLGITFPGFRPQYSLFNPAYDPARRNDPPLI